MTSVGLGVYQRSKSHPSTSAGIAAPSWPQSPRGEPAGSQSPRAYGSTTQPYSAVSRGRSTPAPYVVRPDPEGSQRQIVYEHMASPRYGDGLPTGPQVAARQLSEQNAANEATRAAQAAHS